MSGKLSINIEFTRTIDFLPILIVSTPSSGFIRSAGRSNRLSAREIAALQTYLEELPEDGGAEPLALGAAGVAATASMVGPPPPPHAPAPPPASATTAAAIPAASSTSSSRASSRSPALTAAAAAAAAVVTVSKQAQAGVAGGTSGTDRTLPPAAVSAAAAVSPASAAGSGAGSAGGSGLAPRPPAARSRSLLNPSVPMPSNATSGAAATAAAVSAAALAVNPPPASSVAPPSTTAGSTSAPIDSAAFSASTGETPAPPISVDVVDAAAATAHHTSTSSGGSSGGPPSSLLSPPTQAHPWAQYTPVFAEAYARDLLNSRRNPPAPDASIVALTSGAGHSVATKAATAAAAAAAAKAGEASTVAAPGVAPDAASTSSSTGGGQAPPSFASRAHSFLLQPAPAAGGSIAPAGLTSDDVTGVSLPPGVTSHPSLPMTPAGRKAARATIIKKWGKAGGLSVLASTFSAALPPEALKEVMAQAAAVTAATANSGAAGGALPQGSGVITRGPGGAGGGGGGTGSAWTTVDVGDMGLLDAVLYTLESSHAAARQAAATVRLGGGTVTDDDRAAAAAAAGMGAITAVQMSCLAFRGHAPGAAITCLDHDAEDGRAVTGGNDGRLTLWDMRHR